MTPSDSTPASLPSSSPEPYVPLTNRYALLYRYFLSEMILPFLFGVVAFTSIGTAIGSLFELVRLMAEKGLPIATAAQLYFLQAPRIIVLTFPMSTLLATLLAYGRLSGDSEITALRSCGVSIYKLVSPAILLSLIVTAGTFAFNELVVPQANQQAAAILRSALQQQELQPQANEDILYQEYGDISVPQPDGSIDTESVLQRLFYARRFDGKTMFGITVLDFSQDDFNQIILAEQGVWQPEVNSWLFSKGTSYIVDADGGYRNILNFERQRVLLPRTPLDIGFSPSAEEMTISELQQFIRVEAISGTPRRLRQLQVQLQLKYAIPFICLAFALVGAPLGLRSQRSSSTLGLGLSILIIFGFYLMAFVSQALGQTGTLSPAIAAWLPNLLVGAVGASLIYRAANR
ncbi:MAG: LptF/LptG family permease [Synechococcus sp.]